MFDALLFLHCCTFYYLRRTCWDDDKENLEESQWKLANLGVHLEVWPLN